MSTGTEPVGGELVESLTLEALSIQEAALAERTASFVEYKEMFGVSHSPSGSMSEAQRIYHANLADLEMRETFRDILGKEVGAVDDELLSKVVSSVNTDMQFHNPSGYVRPIDEVGAAPGVFEIARAIEEGVDLGARLTESLRLVTDVAIYKFEKWHSSTSPLAQLILLFETGAEQLGFEEVIAALDKIEPLLVDTVAAVIADSNGNPANIDRHWRNASEKSTDLMKRIAVLRARAEANEPAPGVFVGNESHNLRGADLGIRVQQIDYPSPRDDMPI